MENDKAWVILPWESNGNVREFLASGEWEIPERVSLVSAGSGQREEQKLTAWILALRYV